MGEFIRVIDAEDLVFADTGRGLSELVLALASRKIADAGAGHQVSLVGGVDEEWGAEASPIFHRHGKDAPVAGLDAVLLPESGMEDDIHAGLGEHTVEDLLGDLAFQGDLHPVRRPVMGADGAQEVGGIATDGGRPADIDVADTAGGQASDVGRPLDQGHAQAFPCAGISGDHAGRSTSVYDEVVAACLRLDADRQQDRQKAEKDPFHSTTWVLMEMTT